MFPSLQSAYDQCAVSEILDDKPKPCHKLDKLQSQLPDIQLLVLLFMDNPGQQIKVKTIHLWTRRWLAGMNTGCESRKA